MAPDEEPEAPDADVRGGDVAFNKDGLSQSDVATNAESGSPGTRSPGTGAAVALAVGALSCLL